MQISIIKYDNSDILGYAFKIVDSKSLKKKENIEEEFLIPNNNKEILFNLLSLNYIRTEIVSEKVGNRNFSLIDYNIRNEKNNGNTSKDEIKETNISKTEEIAESSSERKKIIVELTKDKILEMQTKESKDIENFINQLSYYGKDVFLEKHRPNKEKYPVGKGHESLIKITIRQFLVKIEKQINLKSELMRKYKGQENEDDSQNKDIKNISEINQEFSSDTSNYLANIFKSKSILYIKITTLIFFLAFLLIIILEFIFSILNIQEIKDNIYKMRNAYKLSEDIGFIKYCISEVVLVELYKEDYIILKGYNMTAEKNIIWLKEELEMYGFDFRSVYENFSANSESDYSQKYQELVSNSTQILIFTLSNGKETNLTIPFSTAMTRITTSTFYVSTLTDESIVLDMTERNVYELMFNLLNGYYSYTNQLSLILAEDALNSSKTSIFVTIIFYASFAFVILFLVFIWNLLSKLLMERLRPINLFLTIKKQIFEDLKNASEDFSNKLLNKLICFRRFF